MTSDHFSNDPRRVSCSGLSGGDPGLNQRERGMDERRTILLGPFGNQRVFESAAQPRHVDSRIDAQPDAAPAQFSRQPRIVSGHQPESIVAKVQHLGFAQEAVRPIRHGHHRRQRGRLQHPFFAEVIEKNDRATRDQLRRDHLPDFVFVLRHGPALGRQTRRNDADQAGQQSLAGALSGSFDQVNRSEAGDHAPQKGEKDCGDGMGAVRVPHEREVHEQFIHKQRSGARDLLACRVRRDLRDVQGVVGEHPKRVRTMVTGSGNQRGVLSECWGANHGIQRRKPRIRVHQHVAGGVSRGRSGGDRLLRHVVPVGAPGQDSVHCRVAERFDSRVGARAGDSHQGAAVLEKERPLSSVRLLGVVDGMDGGPRIGDDVPQLPVVDLDASQRR